MKRRNKMIVAIVILLLLIASVIGYFVYTDLKEEEKLNNEIQKIMELDLLTDEIDMEIKTKDDYAIVEKEVKNYLNNYVILAKSIINKMQTVNYKNILTPANIQKDVPNFTNSLNTISELTKVTEEIDKLVVMTSEEEIMKPMEKQEVADYYKKLYKKIMLGENSTSKLTQISNQLVVSKESLQSLITKYTNAINFLKTNKGKWEISNNQLYFYDTNLANKYNQIIA